MKGAILFCAAVWLSGCTTRVGAFTFASTKNLGIAYSPLQTRVEGEDCVQSILFIPMGTLNPNIQDAVDRAVETVPNGDMMTNVTVNEDLLFTLIYNRRCVRVTGDVVSTLASASSQREATERAIQSGTSNQGRPVAPAVENPNAPTNRSPSFENF